MKKAAAACLGVKVRRKALSSVKVRRQALSRLGLGLG